jgi:transcriptional regulator NrdR family protein
MMYGQAVSVRRGRTLEPFSRERLLISIYTSCQHRENPVEAASGLADTVLEQLLNNFQDGSVELATIARTTYKVLLRFDNAAATHYQAFHKELLV